MFIGCIMVCKRTDSLAGKRTKILDEYDLRDSIALLYVGRMARNKRIDILIRALKLIRDKTGEKIELLLVGDYLNYYDVYLEARQLARSLDVPDDVVFVGRTTPCCISSIQLPMLTCARACTNVSAYHFWKQWLPEFRSWLQIQP